MIFKLEGHLVHVRYPRSSDVGSIARHAHDREIGRWTFVPYPYSLDDARKFVRFATRERRRGSSLHLAVVPYDPGEAAGMIGLHRISSKQGHAEVGYWLGRKHRGKGIMREALALVLKYAFEELNLKRVFAHVMVGNHASAALLERTGFTQEGRLRQHIRRGKQWRDLLVYGLLREEFKGDELLKTLSTKPCSAGCAAPCCMKRTSK